MTGYWSNITDEMIESASDDTNPLGELAGNPFGEEEEDGNSRKRTAGGEWNEADHPRLPAGSSKGGEFAAAGPSAAPDRPHSIRTIAQRPTCRRKNNQKLRLRGRYREIGMKPILRRLLDRSRVYPTSKRSIEAC